ATTTVPSGGAAVHTVLRLFDSSGNELAVNNGNDFHSQLEYLCTASGTYYLGVSGFANFYYDPNVGGSGPPGNTGDYRLDLIVVGNRAYVSGIITRSGQVPGDVGIRVTFVVTDNGNGGSGPADELDFSPILGGNFRVR